MFTQEQELELILVCRYRDINVAGITRVWGEMATEVERRSGRKKRLSLKAELNALTEGKKVSLLTLSCS